MAVITLDGQDDLGIAGQSRSRVPEETALAGLAVESAGASSPLLFNYEHLGTLLRSGEES